MLKKITQSPLLNLFSGLVLLLTSSYEVVVTADEAFIGVSHGVLIFSIVQLLKVVPVLIFSIVQLLKVVPEIMHGLSEIEEAHEVSAR